MHNRAVRIFPSLFSETCDGESPRPSVGWNLTDRSASGPTEPQWSGHDECKGYANRGKERKFSDWTCFEVEVSQVGRFNESIHVAPRRPDRPLGCYRPRARAR